MDSLKQMRRLGSVDVEEVFRGVDPERLAWERTDGERFDDAFPVPLASIIGHLCAIPVFELKLGRPLGLGSGA